MRAADEYGAAIQYVARDVPVAAKRLAQRIMKRIRSLRRFPESGGFIPEDDKHQYRQLIKEVIGSFIGVTKTRLSSHRSTMVLVFLIPMTWKSS